MKTLLPIEKKLIGWSFGIGFGGLALLLVDQQYLFRRTLEEPVGSKK